MHCWKATLTLSKKKRYAKWKFDVPNCSTLGTGAKCSRLVLQSRVLAAACSLMANIPYAQFIFACAQFSGCLEYTTHNNTFYSTKMRRIGMNQDVLELLSVPLHMYDTIILSGC